MREREELGAVTVKVTGPVTDLNRVTEVLSKNFTLLSKSEILPNDRGQPGCHQYIILYGGELVE